LPRLEQVFVSVAPTRHLCAPPTHSHICLKRPKRQLQHPANQSTMFRTALLIAAACGLASADNLRQGVVEEQPPRELQQGSFDFYVLAQSWQPQFCKGKLNQFPGCRTPQTYWSSHFTLHGLWPEYKSAAYPHDCNPGDIFDSNAVVSAVGKDAMLQYWPNVKKPLAAGDYSDFWKHEWDVHGTCSGLDQPTFFTAVVDLLRKQAITTPDVIQNNVGRSVSADDVRAAFGGSDYVALRCNGGELAEVRTCWAKDDKNMPTSQRKCSTQVQNEDSCRAATIFIRSFNAAMVLPWWLGYSMAAMTTPMDTTPHHAHVFEHDWPGAASVKGCKFDFYVLAQSWQPEFCHGKENEYPGCRAPVPYWRSHLTMHGLWPELEQGKHPGFCKGPAFDPEQIEKAIGLSTLVEYWPDVKVARGSPQYSEFWKHEWTRHGTCSGLGQVAYFSHAINLVRNGTAGTPPLVQQHVGQTVGVDDLRKAFGGPSACVLKCMHGDVFSQVFTCWAKDADHVPTKRIDCPDHVLKEDTCEEGTISIPAFPNDLRFDVFFHMPHQAELSRLRVHRSISLVTLQAMIQREFNVAFEEQRLYYHGDLLEGDEELTFYDIHDQSVINVHVKKRYRRIGDIFSKIKIVRFSKSHADDFEVIDVVASLPPLKVVFRRLAVAIAYLMSLDHMQAQRTGRLVWRQRVNFWDEPLTNTFTRVVPARGNRGAIADHRHLFCPERVSYLMSLAQTVSLRQRLELPPECRSSADLRHIKRWLGSIKYFADANIPDSVIQEIARFSTFASFRSGDYIFREGDVGDFFYIVISGCVSLSAYGNGLFATMTPGMCFGEISLFQTQGRRTATANVNFASQEAELAVVSGDLYRRAINPYKQAVLQNTERAIFSIPQLRFLPDHVITHIAYAAKTLTARTGRRLIRHGDEVHVLVLVVEGEVKPIVSVVRAPAVFGQEGCLGSTPSPAPWDIEAIDNVTLVCLRMDTISIFISPHNGIIRALMLEHQEREIKRLRQSESLVAGEVWYIVALEWWRVFLTSTDRAGVPKIQNEALVDTDVSSAERHVVMLKPMLLFRWPTHATQAAPINAPDGQPVVIFVSVMAPLGQLLSSAWQATSDVVPEPPSGVRACYREDDGQEWRPTSDAEEHDDDIVCVRDLNLATRDHFSGQDRFLHLLIEQQLSDVTDPSDWRYNQFPSFVAQNQWRFELQVGQLIDARDTEGKWYESRVVELDESAGKVKVHYRGWTSKWDEWLKFMSDRLQPLHSRVRNWRDFKLNDVAQIGFEVENRSYPDWRNAVVVAVDNSDTSGNVKVEFQFGDKREWRDAQDELLCPAGTHKVQDFSQKVSRVSDSDAISRYGGYRGYDDGKGSPQFNGVVGLQNLGNTCFMNSMLQCLMNAKPLKDYFMAVKDGKAMFCDDINVNNPLGMRGKIAIEFSKVIRQVWSGKYTVVSPVGLKAVIGDYAPQFAGYQQQDSQELMSFLLDGLHEDLNRVKEKPYTAAVEGNGRDDVVVAAEAWSQYLKRNDSIIVENFMGQLRSHVTCPNSECCNESVTFDPFMSLSVPIPSLDIVTLQVQLFWANGRIPTKYAVQIPKDGNVMDIKQELRVLSGTPANQLYFVEVRDHRITKAHDDDVLVEDLRDSVLHAYELDAPISDHELCSRNLRTTVYYPMRSAPSKPNRLVALFHQTACASPIDARAEGYDDLEEEGYGTAKQRRVELELCNTPLLVSISRDMTKTEIHKKIWQVVERLVSESGEFGCDEQQQLPYRLNVVDAKESSTLIRDFPLSSEAAELPEIDDFQFNFTLEWSRHGYCKGYDKSSAERIQLHDSMKRLSISPQKENLTLMHCLTKFTEREQLAESDTWFCPKCKDHVRAFKKFDIFSLPKVLIFHLKRFRYAQSTFSMHRDKISTLVNFPIDELDMSDYVVGPQRSAPLIYDLFAVSEHSGGLGGGHYTAVAKNPENGQWFSFNDNMTNETKPERAVTPRAYNETDLLVPVPAMDIEDSAAELLALASDRFERRRRGNNGGNNGRGRGAPATGDFDYYVLAQSWQPQFCNGMVGRYPGCSKPEPYWRSHFTLHGLWPNAENGANPFQCSNEEFDADTVVSAVGMDTLLQHWPNVKAAFNTPGYSQFWEHEWSKHGTCSGMDQATYFTTTVKLAQSSAAATPSIIQNNVGRSVQAADLREAYGGANYVALKCRNGNELGEVFTCWAKGSDFLPTEQVECASSVVKSDTCRGPTVSIRAFA
ncbi:TPA: hypothetical protein N0F65_000060, partial [Lagenidium giganteum]